MFDRDAIRKEVEAYKQEQVGVRPAEVVVERFEAYGQCRDSRRIAGLESQLTKARKLILSLYNAGRDTLMCIDTDREEALRMLDFAINNKEIDEFLKETENA